MKKKFAIVSAICLLALTAQAQKYFTRDGKVIFTSDAPMEKIEAENNKVAAVIDAESGAVEAAVLVKSFRFEKALMEEHFNENYMESEKYPKAIFKGTFADPSKLELTQDGSFTLPFSGEVTIHGVTKPLEAEVDFSVSNGAINAKTAFDLAVEEFNIEIPKVVKDNVAKIVNVGIDFDLKVME